MLRIRVVLAAALLFASVSLPALAWTPDPRILNSDTFLDAHPDMRSRQIGLELYFQSNFIDALPYFKDAAWYGDKPSQAIVAEIHWKGINGIKQDKVTAYAWMNLAAERGFKMMEVKRDIYWQSLDEAQRIDALSLSQVLQGEYGDAVAKPRLERRLRMAMSNVTGSRVGSVGALTVKMMTADGLVTFDGSEFYRPELWEPEQYWTWQDKIWVEPQGVVDIGPLSGAEPADTAKPPVE